MPTMGQKFAAAREKKKFTLSRAAALTRIKVQHLEMMENDDFSKMPAPTYAKGFIRIYADLLGLDPEPLVQEYVDRHLNREPEEEVRPGPPRATRVARRRDSTEEEAGSSWTARLKPAFAQTMKRLESLAPHVPRLAAAVVAVLLLVGVVRCAVRIGSDPGKDAARPALLDEQAILKEPPPRYLELPTTEDAQP